jgi:ATP adenylyltransferase
MKALDADAQRAKAQPPAQSEGGNSGGGCFIRQYWLNPDGDQQNHVIARIGALNDPTGGMVFLNAYPYANGHLLVALGESRPRLLDYTPDQRAALWRLVDLATELCEATTQCQGTNIGINQGLASGAGVPEHLHVHVVPRWVGDVNFATVVASVRIIPGAIDAMAQRYRTALPTLPGWQPG